MTAQNLPGNVKLSRKPLRRGAGVPMPGGKAGDLCGASQCVGFRLCYGRNRQICLPRLAGPRQARASSRAEGWRLALAFAAWLVVVVPVLVVLGSCRREWAAILTS